MHSKFICVVFLIFLTKSTLGFINVYPKFKTLPIEGDPGEPLFLTPLIEAGKIQEAQKAAKVAPLEGAEGIDSYSGFLTVHKKHDSNMFFWFFPAQVNYKTAPVVLWLQGGPGATSLFGLFTENGPFSITSDYKLLPRKYSWSKTHSMIFIDNPVGTGFSFTNSDLGYSRNETSVGRNLYFTLLQFFELFPELQKNDFYVTGESYAGKYVPAVAYRIHKNNHDAKIKINLKGIAIGNGLSDPEHMLKYGDYLYQLGLIDTNDREIFHVQETLGVKYIQEKKFDQAFEVFDTLLNGDMTTKDSLFKNFTGFNFYFNYLYTDEPSSGGDLGKYIQRADVRKAIHVGASEWHTDNKVETFLREDIMQSVKPWVETLLTRYRVLFYNGQLDIIVAYPLTLGFLQSLQFPDADAYMKAQRYQWKVGTELAGYVKTAGNLTEILVRNAGHMVPSDQPLWALDLINRFTAGKPFHSHRD